MPGKICTYLLLLLATFTLACEEVIDIDLNEANPEIVVEAVISKDSTILVRISKTTSYFDAGQPEVITDAIISVSNDEGDSETLIYDNMGYYYGTSIVGTEDITYDIEINYNGTLYTSQAYMPPATELISLEAKMFNVHGGPGMEPLYELECRFTERPGEPDFYLIRFIQNNELLDDFYTLTSDFNSEDGVVSYRPGMYLFEEGDSIEIMIFSVDENVYNYFMQLNDAMRGMNMFSTPYNPRTNIDNAILGYFAAWSFVSAGIIIE
jgi:hypothetical protein